MKPFLLYTAARIGLLAVTALVVWLVLGRPALTDVNVLWILLVAMVISSLLAFKLLAGLRRALSASVAQRAEQVSQRVEQARRREDGLD